MGNVFGQVIFVALVFAVTVPSVWLIIRHGDRPYTPPGRAMRIPGRRGEARVLAVLVAVVATGIVAAVLATWPTA